MDFMNLFGKIGKEVVKEEENKFEDAAKFYESLSINEYVELENIKKDVVTLAQKIGDTEISKELGIPLDKLRNWTNRYTRDLHLYCDSEEMLEDDKVLSSDKVIITELKEEAPTGDILEPTQNEKGILSFVIDFDRYTLNVNSEKAREDCVFRLKMITGIDFAWFKEELSLKHWVLYDTRMYKIEDYDMVSYKYLRYRPECGLAPMLPYNATSCYKMFSLYNEVKTLNFGRFRTSHVVDMCAMFENWSGAEEINLSTFETENVIDFSKMFAGCTNVRFITFSSLFKTPSAKNMNYMFLGCENLLELSIMGFSKENLQTAFGMFANCKSLTIINVHYQFDLSTLPDNGDLYDVFENCEELYGFSSEHVGIEMAKPQDEGGYFTAKGRKMEDVSLMDM